MDISKTKVYFGFTPNYLDVTAIVLEKLMVEGSIVIPSNDNERCNIFNSDPYPGIVKHIMIVEPDGNKVIYLANKQVQYPRLCDKKELWKKIEDAELKLAFLHDSLKLVENNFKDERPEQIMALKYIDPNAKILEIGSNIGRNTLVMGSILNDSSNIVTLECNEKTCDILRLNRDLNRQNFHIEPSALSYRKLIQDGYNTIPSETMSPGYLPVNVITFQQLEEKYQIKFDTLVLDCEGAFYYIVLDYPALLDNIKLVIMENDYPSIEQKQIVDYILKSKGFQRVYVQPHIGSKGIMAENFYEVWKKTNLLRLSTPNESPNYTGLWCNKYSSCLRDGAIMKYLQSLELNKELAIPFSDGLSEISLNTDFKDVINKDVNQIIGLLCSRLENTVVNNKLLYLPLDDEIFEIGLKKVLERDVPNLYLSWDERIPKLYFRGTGPSQHRNACVKFLLDYEHADVKFMPTIYNKPGDFECEEMVETRSFDGIYSHNCLHVHVPLSEFIQHKYILVIDGTIIASSLQWVFGSGSVPVLLMNPNNNFWFLNYLKHRENCIIVNDLEKIKDEIEYLVNNDDHAKNIAKNARELSENIFSPSFQREHIRKKLEEF